MTEELARPATDEPPETDRTPDDIGGAAVVVGGASGIGAAVAAAYRDQGRPVVVWDIAGERDIDCDISESHAVDAAWVDTVRRVGLPTELTVSSGVGHRGMLTDASPQDWDRVMGVNAKGVWLVLRAGARLLSGAGMAGSFVATSSISAAIADRGMGLYCASKAALDMMVRVAAAEWGPLGIRVNSISPGVTTTPMLGDVPTDRGWLAEVTDRTPLGRLGGADDIATAVLGLHAMGWVTGQSLVCDGGLSLGSPIDSYGAAQRARSARA